MEIRQVAAQLYTIRDHLKTPSQVAASLKRVKEIGYPAVQTGGLGRIQVGELAKMMEDAGVVCCSTHEDSEELLSRPEAVVERLGTLGCRQTAYPYPGGVKLETLDDVRELAGRLNAAGQVFHEAGVVFAYHNHEVEFRRFEGRLMLEVIVQETDPRYLKLEPDTYWIQYGGGDPEDWCRWLRGRLPMLHLKDYAVNAESRPTFAEVGHGNLNWGPIIAAAEESGCEWYIVEQDRCDRDPFESLRMSFEYIRDNLCS
jgi:sugar phosphate isomerase/epimerase